MSSVTRMTAINQLQVQDAKPRKADGGTSA